MFSAPRSKPPIIDGGLRLGARHPIPSAQALLASLRAAGVDGALAFAESTEQRDGLLADLQAASGRRILGVPLVDIFDSRALQRQSSSLEWGCRILALSQLGCFRSPMQAIDIECIESVDFWRAASASGQILVVEPRLADAHLLPHLLNAFPGVRVLVRGGLVCRPEAQDVLPRKLPLSERFTFDRLHQFSNVWIQLCPADARRVATLPASTKGGWHAHSNLMALFSPQRLVWASEADVMGEFRYRGPRDPSQEIPNLDIGQREALTGGALCALLA